MHAPSPSPARLPRDTLLTVVQHTPLVSVDLICRDPRGRVLLGWRRNRPAQGSWFVPGGRILKDERVGTALLRIAAGELGRDGLQARDFQPAGVWQHLYEDNFAGVAGFGTHYVVLAYTLALPEDWTPVHDDQHGELRWFTADELRCDASVHPNSRAYFDPAIRSTCTP